MWKTCWLHIDHFRFSILHPITYKYTTLWCGNAITCTDSMVSSQLNARVVSFDCIRIPNPCESNECHYVISSQQFCFDNVHSSEHFTFNSTVWRCDSVRMYCVHSVVCQCSPLHRTAREKIWNVRMTDSYKCSPVHSISSLINSCVADGKCLPLGRLIHPLPRKFFPQHNRRIDNTTTLTISINSYIVPSPSLSFSHTPYLAVSLSEFIVV